MRVSGVVAAPAALLACAFFAASAQGAKAPSHYPIPAAGSEPPAWIITPEDAGCRTELDLAARSGAAVPVTLFSDGERVLLRFAMDGAPDRAFLPIRVDQKAYANLIVRGEGPGLAVMTLSDETLAAMRRGKALQIAWLGDEAVRAGLAGAGQGLADLKTCGVQVHGRYQAQQQAAQAEKARAEADQRAKTVADEQLAAIRAQREAAEAEGRAKAAEAERAKAEAEALAAQAEQDRAYAEQARARAQADPYGMPRYPAQPAYDDDRSALPDPRDEDDPPPSWAYGRYYRR